MQHQSARRMCVSVALLFTTSILAVAAHDAPGVTAARAIGPAPSTLAPPPEPVATTAPPVTPAPTAGPTTAAPTTAVAAPTTVARPAPTPASTAAPTLPPPVTLPLPAQPASPAPAGGIGPYLGLGTWVDAYDWSLQFSKGNPTVGPGDMARMAAAGVQTLYLQASKHDSPTDILEPDLVQAIIDTARASGLRVVVWYLPTLVDTGADLRRLQAVAGLRNIDGIAVDIEARNVADVADRNRRLVELSAALRASLPGRTIGAIVLPPVVLEVVNQAFWPSFPYRAIAPSYDVWMTMGYWTNRTDASGYRDAYRYTRENVDRLRNNLGQPDAPVHPIGGIGHHTSAADVEGYRKAVTDVRGIGGSLYDWHTTAAALWAHLRPMRLGGG